MGILGRPWGGLGGFLKGSWALLMRSWGALGRLGELLGGLGAVLGAVDGQECRGSNFPPALGSFLDRLGCPRRCQNGAQDDQKSVKKSSLKMIAF